MRWLKRGMWRAAIAATGLLLLLVLTVWVPASASAHEEVPGFATLGQAQTTPTVDLTVTALAKEQLALQVQQLQNQQKDQNNWFANNSTAIIAAITAIVVAFIGFTQWTGNRRDERQKEIAAQDKDGRAQAEERFKAAITALGDEKEGTQVGGAILLRSFLHEEDKKLYGRYYAQIFDLTVTYLRPSPPVDPTVSLPLTPVRQALIAVFQEIFPLARNRLGQENFSFNVRSLDASHIRLDGATLTMSDLSYIWMRESSLRNATLIGAQLIESKLSKADLSEAMLGAANLYKANLNSSILTGSDLKGSNLCEAILTRAKLNGAILTGAYLDGAYLNDADLSGSDIENAYTLKGTDLRGAIGLSKKQLETCKARGAIMDGDSRPMPLVSMAASFSKPVKE